MQVKQLPSEISSSHFPLPYNRRQWLDHQEEVAQVEIGLQGTPSDLPLLGVVGGVEVLAMVMGMVKGRARLDQLLRSCWTFERVSRVVLVYHHHTRVYHHYIIMSYE